MPRTVHLFLVRLLSDALDMYNYEPYYNYEQIKEIKVTGANDGIKVLIRNICWLGGILKRL